MKRHVEGDDAGFTLIELLMAIVIMGIITVPLGGFMIAYLDNLNQTQNRMADSHDVQIAAAYFSKDVAEVGARTYSGASDTAGTLVQSVWKSPPFPSAPSGCSYGAAPTANPVLLLKADDWTPGAVSPETDWIWYVWDSSTTPNTLKRVACTEVGTPSQATVSFPLIDDLQGASVACDVLCSNAGVPSAISLTLQIATDSSADRSGLTNIVLSGHRRQS